MSKYHIAVVKFQDITEMKKELQRKDALILKHHEQLQQWQKLINQPLGNGLGTPGLVTVGTAPITPAPANRMSNFWKKFIEMSWIIIHTNIIISQYF